MIPRGRLDIAWSDLLYGAASCFAPARRDSRESAVEALWSKDGEALVCLSVRTGLDLLLTALQYPKGSEVLVSAITISDMVRIVEEHGLVPVPVDLDMQTLTVQRESLRRALGVRTRAILVAHLFGSRMRLDEVSAFARENGLLLLEDCAQSFTGLDYRGHPGSDVSMFSFGPIKTCTALGGALVGIKDRELLGRMRALQSRYPVQSRWYFLRRVLRFVLLKVAMYRVPFTLFCASCRLLGQKHDEVISRSVRGFPGPDLFSNLRRRASAPMLALLERRLRRFDGKQVAGRVAAARAVLSATPTPTRLGPDATDHTYWTFPVQSEAPDELVSHLWRHGFDATRGATSLTIVPAPKERADLGAREADQAMSRVVYLPVYPELTGKELQRLTRAAAEFESAGAQ
jgi:dTDP-4-amino-4,6-dideoxygalactose transaminase